MLHEEERKERNHSEILILHECWISFISRNFHNITDNLTLIIIYNIVQHHLSDLTSLFPTFFQVTHVKIMTDIDEDRNAEITGLWQSSVHSDVAFWSFDVGSSYHTEAEFGKRWIVHPLIGNVSWV